MAKIVYVDWKDRQFEPEIIGVFTNEDDGYRARETKESELKVKQRLKNLHKQWMK